MRIIECQTQLAAERDFADANLWGIGEQVLPAGRSIETEVREGKQGYDLMEDDSA